MNLGFSVFLTNLVSTKAVFVAVQQNSCTRRIFAYSQPPQRDIRSHGSGGEDVGRYRYGFMDPVNAGSVVFTSVMFAWTFALASLSFPLCLLVYMVLRRHVAIIVIANKIQCQGSD